jgi:hypothetical protein
MTDWAILEVSDGETTINLLRGEQVGFHLKEWNPAIIQPKGGGVFQDSPIAPGRRLVYDVDGTAIESFDLIVNNYDQNGIIREAQDLIRLLLKGRAYGSTDWQDGPVWIKARAACEDNARYALVINFNIPQLDNPYAQPFFTAAQIAAMDEITLSVERDHWLSEQPGDGAALTATSLQDWHYSIGWEVYGPLGALPSLPAPGGGYWVMAVGNSTVIAAPDDAGATDDTYRSANQGTTWTQPGGVANNVSIRNVIKLANGNIIMSDAANSEQILRSTDLGASWAVASGTVGGGPLLQLRDGRILTANLNGDDVYVSGDSGSTWVNFGTPGTSGVLRQFVQSPTTGLVLAIVAIGTITHIYASAENDLVNWRLRKTYGVMGSSSLSTVFAADQDGNFYGISATGEVVKSANGITGWGTINTQMTTAVGRVLFVDSHNHIWAVVEVSGVDSRIYKSTNGGASFVLQFSFEADCSARNMTESDDGDLYVGIIELASGNGGIVYNLNPDPTEFGTSTDGKLYVVNKQVMAQLTHIYVNDGGVFSANLFPVSAPFQTWPPLPAVNDAIYFGIQTALDNTGPFDNLRFNIEIPASSTVSYAADWEYWTGAAWASGMSLTDNTNAGAGPFSAVGYNSIHFYPPSNWATTSVNGVTGYWIRCRVSAISGTLTPPTHGDSDLITVNNAFIEAAADQVGGDVPALLRVKFKNESDFQPSTVRYDHRVIAGLRSYDRGPRFQAYINLSDEQNPEGITVSLGTNTTFENDILGPTGRRTRYNPTGSEAIATRATVTLDSSIARDYYGTFHVFLRATSVSASASGLSVRLQFISLTGGITQTTVTYQPTTARQQEAIDFGQITFPVAGFLKTSELSDTFQIIIQAGSTSTTPDFYFYDIILIPVDEWALDAVDVVNTSLSVNGEDRFLDIDGLTPKTDIRTLVRYDNVDEVAVSEWNPITNGPPILQANARQRLWFFCVGDAPAIVTDNCANPVLAHSIQPFKNQRYLGMRGDR